MPSLKRKPIKQALGIGSIKPWDWVKWLKTDCLPGRSLIQCKQASPVSYSEKQSLQASVLQVILTSVTVKFRIKWLVLFNYNCVIFFMKRNIKWAIYSHPIHPFIWLIFTYPMGTLVNEYKKIFLHLTLTATLWRKVDWAPESNGAKNWSH